MFEAVSLLALGAGWVILRILDARDVARFAAKRREAMDALPWHPGCAPVPVDNRTIVRAA